MAAPSSTVWGSIVSGSENTRKGRLGIYTDVTTSNTSVTVNVQVWFWSMYSAYDNANEYYYNARSDGNSEATTLIGPVTITHTVTSGEGWSTTNQTKIGESTYTYTRGTSSFSRYYDAKLTGVEGIGANNKAKASTSVTIPALTSYTISYNANGGSGAPSSQTKYYGKSITLSSTKPTRTGYTFKGWATSSSGSVAYDPGDTYTSNSKVTLYAVWTPVTYSVQYNANGGSGAPSSQTKTYNVTLTLSSTKPTRASYNFKGWSTSASSSVVSYQPGGSYSSNAAVTLYAVWELAYTRPRIDNLSVERCNSSGEIIDDGTYALVKFTWASDQTISSVRIECTYDGDIVASKNVSSSGTSGSVSAIVGDNKLSNELTYTVRVTVTDASGSSDRFKTLNGLVFTIDALAGGKGVSFGKPAEIEGYADFAYKMVSINSCPLCHFSFI